MDVVFVNVVPLKSEGFGFSQSSEQQKFIKDAMYWVLQAVNCRAPFAQIFDDRSVWTFFEPFDGEGRGFR